MHNSYIFHVIFIDSGNMFCFSLLKIIPGADMVSIHNEEENAFILDTLKKQWKGPDDILLGMFFDTDGK